MPIDKQQEARLQSALRQIQKGLGVVVSSLAPAEDAGREIGLRAELTDEYLDYAARLFRQYKHCLAVSQAAEPENPAQFFEDDRGNFVQLAEGWHQWCWSACLKTAPVCLLTGASVAASALHRIFALV